MIAWNQRATGREPINQDSSKPAHAPPFHPNHPRQNYFTKMFDEDPFPDSDLMELDEESQDETDRKEIEDMIQNAMDNDNEQRFFKPFRELVWQFR